MKIAGSCLIISYVSSHVPVKRLFECHHLDLYQVNVQLLGTPPPIQQFGYQKMANATQGHKRLSQQGDMHAGTSAR